MTEERQSLLHAATARSLAPTLSLRCHRLLYVGVHLRQWPEEQAHGKRSPAFRPARPGAASWRPLAPAHGRAGRQSRAEPHLVTQTVITAPPLRLLFAEFPPASIEPAVVPAGLAREGQCHLAFTPHLGQERSCTFLANYSAASVLGTKTRQGHGSPSLPGPTAPSCRASRICPQGSVTAPGGPEEAAGRALVFILWLHLSESSV